MSGLSVVLVIVSVPDESTVSVYELVAVCAVGVELSVAVTLNVNAPELVGVPLSTPVPGLSVSPSGNDPEVTAHVYGWVPPIAVRISE